MRVFVVVCLVLGLWLTEGPAVAQEAEVLRQELEQLKQQLQIMQQQYQFSYLIVPALAGIAVGGPVSTRLLVGWAFGTGVSVLGLLASALLDLPTGATVACMFGLLLLLWYSITYLLRAGGGAGAPSSHSIERAFSDKGAA